MVKNLTLSLNLNLSIFENSGQNPSIYFFFPVNIFLSNLVVFFKRGPELIDMSNGKDPVEGGLVRAQLGLPGTVQLLGILPSEVHIHNAGRTLG